MRDHRSQKMPGCPEVRRAEEHKCDIHKSECEEPSQGVRHFLLVLFPRLIGRKPYSMENAKHDESPGWTMPYSCDRHRNQDCDDARPQSRFAHRAEERCIEIVGDEV